MNIKVSFKEKDYFWLAPLIVMGIGLFPMPYGYYFLSRIVVCVCAVYFASQLYRANEQNSVFIFGGIAVLYNPLFPIHLGDKSIWIVVNIITGILFFTKKSSI